MNSSAPALAATMRQDPACTFTMKWERQLNMAAFHISTPWAGSRPCRLVACPTCASCCSNFCGDASGWLCPRLFWRYSVLRCWTVSCKMLCSDRPWFWHPVRAALPQSRGACKCLPRAVGGSRVGVVRPRSQGLVSPKSSAGCSGCLAAATHPAAMEADHQYQSLPTHTSNDFTGAPVAKGGGALRATPSCVACVAVVLFS